MKTIRTVAAMREHTAAARAAGRSIGLVPTMGAFHGGHHALTGPIARGDEETVARQREAIAERTPDLLPLFDALVDATRELVA